MLKYLKQPKTKKLKRSLIIKTVQNFKSLGVKLLYYSQTQSSSKVANCLFKSYYK